MMNYYITFRSVTYAQRGEAALRNAGIRCVLQRAARFMEERGCGYSLRLGQAEAGRGLEILKTRQIPFRKVYVKRDDGTLEEVVQ